jgi:hypothetical protein
MCRRVDVAPLDVQAACIGRRGMGSGSWPAGRDTSRMTVPASTESAPGPTPRVGRRSNRRAVQWSIRDAVFVACAHDGSRGNRSDHCAMRRHPCPRGCHTAAHISADTAECRERRSEADGGARRALRSSAVTRCHPLLPVPSRSRGADTAHRPDCITQFRASALVSDRHAEDQRRTP